MITVEKWKCKHEDSKMWKNVSMCVYVCMWKKGPRLLLFDICSSGKEEKKVTHKEIVMKENIPFVSLVEVINIVTML